MEKNELINGESVGLHYTDVSDYYGIKPNIHESYRIMRVTKDKKVIESDHSARVDVDIAKRILKFVISILDSDYPSWEGNLDCGYYKLRQIKDGKVIVGCHTFAECTLS